MYEENQFQLYIVSKILNQPVLILTQRHSVQNRNVRIARVIVKLVLGHCK